jgi:hypothetical protein
MLRELVEQLSQFDSSGVYIGGSKFLVRVPQPGYPSEIMNIEAEDITGGPVPYVKDDTINIPYIPVTPEEEKNSSAMADLLAIHGFSDISVEVRKGDGHQVATFVDDDNDTSVAVFGVDDEEGAFAFISSQNEDPTSDEVTFLDLDYLEPPFDTEGNIDLSDPSWLNRSALVAILSPLSLGSTDVGKSPDGESFVSVGYLKAEPLDEGIISSLKRTMGRAKSIMHGGRVIKIPVFQRISKSKLSNVKKTALKTMYTLAASARAKANWRKAFKRGGETVK